jgi:hypothetical protein
MFADHNSHNRDGQGRHRITAGKINYWPNRFEAVPPVPPSEGGFKSYPEKVSGKAERLKSKKFAEHINQAQLFYNSLTQPETALGFELDHCDEAIVYERICDRLRVRPHNRSAPTSMLRKDFTGHRPHSGSERCLTRRRPCSRKGRSSKPRQEIQIPLSDPLRSLQTHHSVPPRRHYYCRRLRQNRRHSNADLA